MPLKFLVIQTAFTGDVVLATALIENLHAQYPQAQIDFLLRKGNEGLLTNHPFLANLLVWNKKEKKLPHLFALLRRIRKEKYDKVINVQRYGATGMLTAFSGAGETIGFDKNPLSFLFSKKIKHVFTGLHETEKNHLLIAHLTDKKVMRPALYPSAHDETLVKKYIQKKFITISAASVWFTKQYPPEKWVDLVRSAHEYTIYLLGGKDDRALGDKIVVMAGISSVINLCGELSFLQSAALMKYAHMNYVNDSAPMHFASSVNAPVTVVYCSTVPAFGYGPLSDTQFIVERPGPLYCRPCGLHGHRQCPEGHFKCALEIRVEQLGFTQRREG